MALGGEGCAGAGRVGMINIMQGHRGENQDFGGTSEDQT